MSQSVIIRPDEDGKLPSFNIGSSSVDFVTRDFTTWHVRHSAHVTVASTTYESLPVDLQSASAAVMALQSNNNGTLKVLYTYDTTNWFAVTITGVLDPEAAAPAKYNFEWTKGPSVVQAKYKYTETDSVGLFTGGFAITEKVGT